MKDIHDIIFWMIENRLAENNFSASHIATGLKLWELTTEDAMKARIKLYRRWRPKSDKKNMIPTYQAFDLAIAGIDPVDVVTRQMDWTIDVEIKL